MNRFLLIVLSVVGLVATTDAQTQISYSKGGQAMPAFVQTFGKEAFVPSEHTEIRWLGSAGFLINSRGTCLMVDPMLKGFDMPVLLPAPISPEEVTHLA